jgi:predicted house-cleaning NTP pyrophosphatase (Maf/HAM1 superfamily)
MGQLHCLPSFPETFSMGSHLRFILASASPARRHLLKTIGIQAEVEPSQFDESTIQTTNPIN